MLLAQTVAACNTNANAVCPLAAAASAWRLQARRLLRSRPPRLPSRSLPSPRQALPKRPPLPHQLSPLRSRPPPLSLNCHLRSLCRHPLPPASQLPSPSPPSRLPPSRSPLRPLPLSPSSHLPPRLSLRPPPQPSLSPSSLLPPRLSLRPLPQPSLSPSSLPPPRLSLRPLQQPSPLPLLILHPLPRPSLSLSHPRPPRQSPRQPSPPLPRAAVRTA